MPVRRVRFYRIERRHELRVRDSYDRMMGRWRHPEGAPDEPASNDQRAA